MNKIYKSKESGTPSSLEVFLNPASVAVIGASERSGSWGSFIMGGLFSRNYSGRIYPVNSRADQVFGIPAFKDIREISEPVDLAVCAVPEKFLEETIRACGQKGVKGITIITGGFGETSEQGQHRQESLARLARSFCMQLIGPNVSGTFNLHAGFNASSISAENLLATPIAAVCQGGYAFYDILSSGWTRGMGVGKFIHTGNECDLTVTDFLELFGQDPEVKAIIMYIEALRDGRRFLEVARQVATAKPVVVYKGGKSADSARAARSHTGALAGEWKIYQSLFRQVGIVAAPAMELLLPIAHALIERPPMEGNRVAIITMGGSWGVALSDCLVETGLSVPEFSGRLQEKLRSLGTPARASVKNPVDFGASGRFLDVDFLTSLGRAILSSAEVDALILHGVGRPGMHGEETDEAWKIFLEIEKTQVEKFCAMERKYNLPVLIGSHYSPWESQTVHDLNQQGVRIYNRLHEISWLAAAMDRHWRGR